MKPTVGRIVHYKDLEHVYAALIVWVFSDTCVNLVVWNSDGTSRVVTSCLKTELVDGYEEGRWQWPPRT